MFAKWRIHRIHHYDISWPSMPCKKGSCWCESMCLLQTSHKLYAKPRALSQESNPPCCAKCTYPGKFHSLIFNQAVLFQSWVYEWTTWHFSVRNAENCFYNQNGHVREGMWQADRTTTLTTWMKTWATIRATMICIHDVHARMYFTWHVLSAYHRPCAACRLSAEFSLAATGSEAQVDGIRMLHTVGENWLRSLEMPWVFAAAGRCEHLWAVSCMGEENVRMPQNGRSK